MELKKQNYQSVKVINLTNDYQKHVRGELNVYAIVCQSRKVTNIKLSIKFFAKFFLEKA